jgi:hypothetical protein
VADEVLRKFDERRGPRPVEVVAPTLLNDPPGGDKGV